MKRYEVYINMYIVYHSQVSQLVSLTFSDVVIMQYILLLACFRWDKNVNKSTSNFLVEPLDVKKKYGPIVYVMLGSGCVNIAL